jgi:hypothetical protein
MDVRVVAAQSPLSPEFRDAMRPVTGEPIPWESSPAADLRANPTADLRADATAGLRANATANPRTNATADLRTNAVAAGIVPPPGRITGSGPALAVDPAENAAFTLISRVLGGGGGVRFAAGTPSVLVDGEVPAEDGPTTPSVAADARGGRYLVSGIDRGTLEQWVNELALRAERARDDGPAVRSRIAIYEPWTASMDAGWTRWLFDRYGFEYTTIRNADVQAANLRERYDVIVLASDPARTLLDGYAEGTVPRRYAGGIGATGARALDAFVRAGGTLVCLNRSTAFAIEQLHLPVQDALADLERDEFFASGSILEVITDPAHPIMAGMPQRAKIFVDGSPAFTTLDGFRGSALAKYAPAGSPLLSGYLLGEEHLNGLAAALDVRHGAGHVILIGFRPQWRGQPHGTFRVLFNAVLFANEHAARASGTPGFWQAPEVQVDTAAAGH